MEDLIVVKVRDQDPLTVDRNILTTSSPVFNRLINEFLQTEIDMEDFDTEAVTVFLTYLNSNPTRYVGRLDSDLKRIDFFERQSFRELHKLIIVFEVGWMKEECHRYFSRLIRSNGTIQGVVNEYCISSHFRFIMKGWEFDDSMFVFEECKYMVNKWGSRFMPFIDLFVDAIRNFKPGSGWNMRSHYYCYKDRPSTLHYLSQRRVSRVTFLKKYVIGLSNFTRLEVDVLLRIVRYYQVDIVMAALLKLLEDQNGEELVEGSVLKYLLENLNLSLCRIRQPEMYQQIVNILTTRFESQSLKDMKFVYRIVAESAKLPLFREIRPVYNLKSFDWMRETIFLDANDVLLISEHKNIESVNAIVDFILYIILKFHDAELPPIDPKNILEKVEDICRERGLTRAHRPYIQSSLQCLEFIRQSRSYKCDCPCRDVYGEWVKFTQNLEAPCDDWIRHNDFHPANMEYIKLLGLIKESHIVSSQHEHEVVYLGKKKSDANMYYFEHPGVPDCSRKGKCGFIIKTGTFISPADREVKVMKLHRDDTWTSKESDDRVHCHDIISPENISLNYIQLFGDGFRPKYAIPENHRDKADIEPEPDRTCAMPYPLYREFVYELFHPDSMDLENHEQFVMYNVADYLVTKNNIH